MVNQGALRQRFFSCGLPLVSSACRRRSSSSHVRKKPLVPRVLKASNFKKCTKFPSRIKKWFLESFQGSQTQFQSKRSVVLWIDVYVSADLYQAKRPDMSIHCLFAFGAGI